MSVVRELGRRLRSGEASAAGLVSAALAAVEATQASLASFVAVNGEAAVAAAEQLDAELAAGRDRGPLHGVPVGIKDIADVGGLPTRCGSEAYPSKPAPRDAAVVARLRAGGAVVVGKTTAHELACGVYSAPAANPWDVGRIPGGSSGGSGAAVAAGIVPVALGSDTGGSIRIPAAVCGVAGLKPTFGRVSRAGVEPLSWTLDHVGPLGATAADCAVALGVMAGRDPDDAATLDEPVPDFTAELEAGVTGMRVGVLRGAPVEPLQPDVADAFAEAVEQLAELGAEPVEVTVPELAHTLAVEFAIVAAEAAHHHRRLLREQPDLIDPGIRALLVAGTLLPGSQYFKASEARVRIDAAIRRVFEGERLDAMVSPTLPATAAGRDQDEFVYGETTEAVTLSYVRTTAPFNLSGLPALSLPCGLDRDGLPVGLQVAGRPLAETTVLRVGAAYEASTTWHERRPPLHALEGSR